MLRGKFIRREGTMVIFGTRSKPEWKPIEVSGQIDPTQLVPGEYYELDLDNNRLTAYRKLASRTPGTYQPPNQGLGQSSSHEAPAASSKVPAQSLCASATGIVKSCLDAGMTLDDAMNAGILWASMWGDPPMKKAAKEIEDMAQEAPRSSGELGGPYEDW